MYRGLLRWAALSWLAKKPRSAGMREIPQKYLLYIILFIKCRFYLPQCRIAILLEEEFCNILHIFSLYTIIIIILSS